MTPAIRGLTARPQEKESGTTISPVPGLTPSIEPIVNIGQDGACLRFYLAH